MQLEHICITGTEVVEQIAILRSMVNRAGQSSGAGAGAMLTGQAEQCEISYLGWSKEHWNVDKQWL